MLMSKGWGECWVVRCRCSVITHPPCKQGLTAVGSPGPVTLGCCPSPLSTLRAEARSRGYAVSVLLHRKYKKQKKTLVSWKKKNKERTF
jgi:hypothetical protein